MKEVLIHLVLILLNFLLYLHMNTPLVSLLGCPDFALSCVTKLWQFPVCLSPCGQDAVMHSNKATFAGIERPVLDQSIQASIH